jgi:hypothetical protein
MSQVKDILQKIGIKITFENDSGYAQFCPIYRDSKNPAGASIDLKSGWVTDWAEDERFPLDVLVKRVTGEGLDEQDLKLFEPIYEPTEKERDYWSKDSLLHLLPNHEYWMKRGISKETLDFFQGGVAHGGKLYQRYVWPVFDRHQRIIGFTGRDITGEAKIKYKHEGKSSHFLFGLFNKLGSEMPILRAILESSHVILVEGGSDSVSCYDEGVKNVLPTTGLSLSKTMLSFLMGVNPDKIILCYNRDKNGAGQDAMVKNFTKLAQHFPIESLEMKYPIGNDLADNKKKIKEWVDMPADSAIVEFREKYKRCENRKHKNLNGAKKMTQMEIKIGKELSNGR